jgi:hypothetical protein
VCYVILVSFDNRYRNPREDRYQPLRIGMEEMFVLRECEIAYDQPLLLQLCADVVDLDSRKPEC